MKKDNINYLMVGSFVLVSMLLLFFMLFKITGMQSGADNYFVVFKNVTGIKNGSAVTYGGYKIGQIENIEPIFNHGKTSYKIKLKVKGGWKIPEDSMAEVVMPGVISDKQIEITEGKSVKVLQSNDVILSKESTDLMLLASTLGNEVGNLVTGISDDVSGLLKKLNRSADQISMILSDENRAHIEKMFKNTDEATTHLVKLSKGFDRVNDQLETILTKSISIVGDNDQDIRYSVIELRKTMDTVSGNIHSILYNLDASSRNMNEFTRQIRDNPSVILGSKPPVDESEAHK
jgi:phospholipid/cholesterol/gamma-HCH transport system substrate-binding protein